MNKQPIRIVFFDPDRGWVEDTWDESASVTTTETLQQKSTNTTFAANL